MAKKQAEIAAAKAEAEAAARAEVEAAATEVAAAEAPETPAETPAAEQFYGQERRLCKDRGDR